jgi:hypothetical protein
MVSGQLRVIRYSPYCTTAIAVTKELLKKVTRPLVCGKGVGLCAALECVTTASNIS